MGILEYTTVNDAATSVANRKKTKTTYQRWTPSERSEIGKYGAQHATARKVLTKEKQLNESSVRRFVKLYQEELKKTTKKGNTNDKLIPIRR